MPKSRSPVLGYNHNIRHKGWVFHVQTEDSGVLNPHIFTHLFHAGVIVASKKLEYDAEADDDIVKGLMQAQHKSVMKELLHGAYDSKIDAYLGPAPASQSSPAVTDELLLDADAGSTIPSAPPDVEDGDAGMSSPYVQMVVGDDSQSVISGTLSISESDKQLTAMLEADPDTDDEINGLLNRLREETPIPELDASELEATETETEPEAPSPVPAESPGAWIVARPGQKERPFDRNGPVPEPIRDEVVRRTLTPPAVPIGGPPTVQQPAIGLRRPSVHQRAITPPPVAVAPTRHPSQAGTPVSAVRPGAANPPTRPVPPLPARSTSSTPVLPRGYPPGGPSPSPVLPRGSAAVSGNRAAISNSSAFRMPPQSSSRSSHPIPPPVLPRSQSIAPLGARPAARASSPAPAPSTPPGGSRPPTPPVTVAPRRAPSQESVVVARPAVVIGAPPTVIGGPADQSAPRRMIGGAADQSAPRRMIGGAADQSAPRRVHGREPSNPGAPGESLFGQDLISEKSLDEVIMAYLSEESSED